MNIQSKDFRVPEGARVDLNKWPTRVKRSIRLYWNRAAKAGEIRLMRNECMEALEAYIEPDMVQATKMDSSKLTKRFLRRVSLFSVRAKSGVYAAETQKSGA